MHSKSKLNLMLLAFMALVIVGCTNTSTKNNDETKTDQVVVYTDDNKLISNDSKNYQSKEYGFSIQMPEAWQGFRIIQSSSDKYNPDKLTPIQYYDFYYPTTEKNVSDIDGFYSIFTITVWDVTKVAQGTKILDEIGRNNTFVFSADVGEVTAGLPGDIPQSVVDGVANIIKSFSSKSI